MAIYESIKRKARKQEEKKKEGKKKLLGRFSLLETEWEEGSKKVK